jgi:two-component system, response regulator
MEHRKGEQQMSVDMLLVEDSRGDAQMAMRVLLKRKIADRVEWVRDGREALDYLFREGQYANREAGNPKVVVLDINMPGLNGLQVLDSIRTHLLTRTVPVVLFTTSEMPVDLRMGYERGANSYIVKPVCHKEFTELLVKIGQYWIGANRTLD